MAIALGPVGRFVISCQKMLTTDQPIFAPCVLALELLAVYALCLFHIWPSEFSNGFLGADVLFTIWGFVHAFKWSINAKQLYKTEANHVDILKQLLVQYWMELRQILLTIAITICATLIAGHILLFEREFNALLDDIPWALFLGINHKLSEQDWISELIGLTNSRPLFHFWVPSVLVQFIVVFPTIFLILHFIARKLKYASNVSAKIFFSFAFAICAILSISFWLWSPKKWPLKGRPNGSFSSLICQKNPKTNSPLLHSPLLFYSNNSLNRMQKIIFLILIALWLGQSFAGPHGHKAKDHIPELEQFKKLIKPHTDACRKAFPANKAKGNDSAAYNANEKEACERVQKMNQTVDTIIGHLKADQPPSKETAEELNKEIRAIFNESIDKFVEIIEKTRAKLDELVRGKAGLIALKYDQMEMNDEKAQSLQKEMKTLAKQLENKNLRLSEAEREARNYEILMILMKLHLHSMGPMYADPMGACPMQKQPPSCRIQNQNQPQQQEHNQALNFADLVTRKKRADSDELQPQPGCYGCWLELWEFTQGIFAMLASFWEVPRFILGIFTFTGYIVVQTMGCACLSTFGVLFCLAQPSLMKSFCFCKDTPGNNVIKWKRTKEENEADFQNQSCCGCWSKFGQGLCRWYHVGYDFKRKEKVAVGVPVPNVQHPIPPQHGHQGPYYGQPGGYPPQPPPIGHYGKSGYPGGSSGR